MSDLPGDDLKMPRGDYRAPEAGAVRSPCPALNALANCGYIRRDGKHIKLTELVGALIEVYNISRELALLLAGTGILLCGDVLSLSVDLNELARHNRIEHDFSLVHADAKKGEIYAPTTVDEKLVEQLLAINNVESEPEKDYLTEADFIRHRQRLMGEKKLDRIHAKVASGEVIMIFDVFGELRDKLGKDNKPMKDDKGNVLKEWIVKKSFIDAWMHRETIPEGWRKPSRQITLSELNGQQKEYQKIVEELLGQHERGNLPEGLKKSPKEYVEELLKKIHGDLEGLKLLSVCPHARQHHHHH